MSTSSTTTTSATTIMTTTTTTSTSSSSTPLQDRVLFESLCRLFRMIEDAPKEKVKVLSRFVEKWRVASSQDANIDSFYSVMRLMIPHLDIHRSAYQMKELKIKKEYISYLGLTKDKGAGMKLERYKERDIVGASAGDLSRVVRDVLQGRCFFEKDNRLTIRDINNLLDVFAEAGAMKESDESNQDGKKETAKQKRHAVMNAIVRRGTNEENFWFTRIVLKDLRIGLKEDSIWKAFHPQASELWSRTSDLRKVCLTLHTPEIHALEEIKCGQPCGVMLAQDSLKKKAIETVLKKLPEYCLEVKYDGERIHLHKDADTYHYFSRNRFEFKRAYDSDDADYSHPKNIGKLFHRSVRNCILDGEMVGFDRTSRTIVLKGENFDVKAIGSDGITRTSYPNVVQCYIVFDIVFLNDEPVYTRPLSERKQILKQILKPDGERIILSKYELAQDPEEFKKFANKAIEDREEGVMIKNWSSDYKLGKRDGAWLKWKPEYVDSLVDELDLLIVGGYYGEGSKRSGGISHFMLAVAEPPEPGQLPTKFNSFCKVGTGYTLKELKAVQEKLKHHWKKCDPSKGMMWDNVKLAMPGYKEKPDVWIEPENSLVVQIKAAEITPTDKFAARYTLRFPRLSKFRFDKAYHECMLQSSLAPLHQSASGKLAHKLLEGHHLQLSHDKRAKKGTGRGQTHTYAIAPHFKGADLRDVQRVSRILEGMKVKIVSKNKQELEKLLFSHGGEVMQQSGPGVVIVADKESAATKASVKTFDTDVLKTKWLRDCCKYGVKYAFTKKYMVHASQRTKEEMKTFADQYGDVYEAEMTLEDFDDIMGEVILPDEVKDGQIPSKRAKLTAPTSTSTASTSPSRKEKVDRRGISEDSKRPTVKMLDHYQLASLESNYLGRILPLRLANVYLDIPQLHEHMHEEEKKILQCNSLHLAELDIYFLGGRVSASLNETCTHIVVNSEDLSRVAMYDRKVREWAQKPKIVSREWVSACYDEDREVDERVFMVKALPHNGKK
eukprot:m.101261 g.101261  ORF g.101261 m.101261 type:complete len:1007 (-) comp9062_c4_seq2:48-3068(-)